MDGWAKIKPGAKHAGVSERTLRGWLNKGGLKHSRLPSGTILIRYEAIDEYLERYTIEDNQVDKIVSDTLKEF